MLCTPDVQLRKFEHPVHIHNNAEHMMCMGHKSGRLLLISLSSPLGYFKTDAAEWSGARWEGDGATNPAVLLGHRAA